MNQEDAMLEMHRLVREAEDRVARRMSAEQKGEAFRGLENSQFGWRPTAIVPDGMAPSVLRRAVTN